MLLLSTGWAYYVDTPVSTTNVTATTAVIGSLSTTSIVSAAGLSTSRDITATGRTVTAATFTGTSLGGTLTTAAQTNITSLGTLTGLTVNGSASATQVNIGGAGYLKNFSTALDIQGWNGSSAQPLFLNAESGGPIYFSNSGAAFGGTPQDGYVNFDASHIVSATALYVTSTLGTVSATRGYFGTASASTYYGDGSHLTGVSGGGSTSPSGNTKDAQYNNSGSFAGSDNFTWDNANNTLGVSNTISMTMPLGLVTATSVDARNVSGTSGAFGGLTVSGIVTATSYITATTYYGDGSHLSGISAGSSVGLIGFQNLVITTANVSASQYVDVSADAVVLADVNGIISRTTSLSARVDSTASGAAGLDTGSMATSTWYSVWAIAGASGKSALISTASSAPTLPGGYTYYARIGWVRSDASANKYLLKTIQRGRRAQYVVQASTNTPVLPTVASGTVGNLTTPTWVAESISNIFPTTASVINMMMSANVTFEVAPNNNYGSYASLTNSPPCVYSAASSYGLECSLVPESTNIYYASNNPNSRLQALGWEDGF
jgi:hypothetical protein